MTNPGFTYFKFYCFLQITEWDKEREEGRFPEKI